MNANVADGARIRPATAAGLFVSLRVGEIAAAFLILTAANALAPIDAHFAPWIAAYWILVWEYAFWQYGVVCVLAWAAYFAVTRLRVRAWPLAVFNAALHPLFIAAWQLQYAGFGKGFGGTLWYSAAALAAFDFLFAFLVLRLLGHRGGRRGGYAPSA